jgi:hypothetical protein
MNQQPLHHVLFSGVKTPVSEKLKIGVTCEQKVPEGQVKYVVPEQLA